VPVVPQAQVFVLAGHDLVAVALEKASHLASTHWRQCESFLFAHNTRSVALCVLPRTCNALARVACNRESASLAPFTNICGSGEPGATFFARAWCRARAGCRRTSSPRCSAPRQVTACRPCMPT
jgi:hypothetical protein